MAITNKDIDYLKKKKKKNYEYQIGNEINNYNYTREKSILVTWFILEYLSGNRLHSYKHEIKTTVNIGKKWIKINNCNKKFNL